MCLHDIFLFLGCIFAEQVCFVDEQCFDGNIFVLLLIAKLFDYAIENVNQ